MLRNEVLAMTAPATFYETINNRRSILELTNTTVEENCFDLNFIACSHEENAYPKWHNNIYIYGNLSFPIFFIYKRDMWIVISPWL